MATISVTKKGFISMKIDRGEMIKTIKSPAICDHCNQTPAYGFYIPVLNSWICPECFTEWHRGAKHYQEDEGAEMEHLKTYLRVFYPGANQEEILGIITRDKNVALRRFAAPTPGDWLAHQVTSGTTVIMDKNGREIAKMSNPDGIDQEEMKANARIIEAAHKMLEVLQSLENDNGAIPNHAWTWIRQAINEAVGGKK